MFASACVATAPAPARAHGTTEPTARNFEATATPRSPVSGSRATIEKVTPASRLADPGVDQRDRDVDQDVHDHDADRGEQHGPHQERQILRPDGVERELADAGP